MRGSKFELKFDFKGQPTNEEEIRCVLKKEKKSAGTKSEEEKMEIS